MTRNSTALAGFFGAVFALVSLPAQNQSYDQFAPKPVPPAPVSPANLPPSTNTVAGAPGEILLPVLKGLVFLSRPEDLDPHGAAGAAGITLHAGLPLPAPEQFRALVTPFVGQPLTRGRLNELITAIIVHYRGHDHPVVDVIVPEQDISTGIVQVLLLETRAGTVTVTGNHWFSSDEIRRNFRLQAGDRIAATAMREDLEWANQNPFHTSDVIYQPGTATGTTDVVLQTTDRFPLRLYAGYEDSGNRQTGFDRYLAGLNWGDAWHAGWGHQLNYQYTTSGDLHRLEAHSGSYVVPLPWHHTLTFFGNYVQTEGAIPPLISVHGRSYQLSGRYDVPLRPVGDYKHTLGAGFDYKYNRNALQFGDIPLTTVPVEVRQLVLTYDGSRRDRWGITSLSLQLYLSPGNWGGDNSDAVFDQSHTLATSNYAYGNLTLSRLTRLPDDWSLFLKGTWQASDANLTPSEQLGLGGYDTVRGYDERELNSDEGYIYNLELRTPVFTPGKILGVGRGSDQLQFLVFWDYGSGRNHTPLPGEPPHRALSALGVGLRYTIKSNVSIRADYGFQLLKTGLDEEHGGRGDLGVVISY